MIRPRVFISYSHEDQPLVQSVTHWLKNSEFRSADVDDPAKSVSWGDDVRTLITDKIRQADLVLLLWSDRAARSPWVQYEMGMAEAFEVPIRVLLADESSAKLPAELASTQVVKLDIPIDQSAAGGVSGNSVRHVSVSTALEDLKQQSQRIEQTVQHVSEMLSSSSVEVVLQDGETLESALRRFKRKAKHEDLIKEIKRHSFYLRPSEKRRTKEALARKRSRKKRNREVE